MNFSHEHLTSTLFGTNYGEKVVLEFFLNIYEVSGLATLDQDGIFFKLFLQMVRS